MHMAMHDNVDIPVLCTQPYYAAMAIINSNRLTRLNFVLDQNNSTVQELVQGAKMMIELVSVTIFAPELMRN